MTTTPSQIVAQARTYLGTPFHHQGRLCGVGIDCPGLVVCVGHDLGLFDYAKVDYSAQAPPEFFYQELAKVLVLLPVDQAGPGDVLFFWVHNPSWPSHLGIQTDYGFIHADQTIGKVVEHRLTMAWRRRIVASYRMPGVN